MESPLIAMWFLPTPHFSDRSQRLWDLRRCNPFLKTGKYYFLKKAYFSTEIEQAASAGQLSIYLDAEN